MSRSVIAAISMLAAGGLLWFTDSQKGSTPARILSLEQRLQITEQTLDRLAGELERERAARRALEAAFNDWHARSPPDVTQEVGVIGNNAHARQDRGSAPPGQALSDLETQLQMQGLSAHEVDTIIKHKRRLIATDTQTAWERRRANFLEHPEQFRLEVVNPLRAQLGDPAYQRYLEAQGRRIGAVASGVLPNSAADHAGIQPGDRIVRFDGERIFHLNELLMLSAKGNPGEPVAVEILRRGEWLYLTMRRGPLGLGVPDAW